MPSVQQKQTNLRRAIRELDEAAQEFAFKGSYPPSEHDFIEARYRAALLKLRLITGAVDSTPKVVKRLHQLEAIVKLGYDGPTDEEREAADHVRERR